MPALFQRHFPPPTCLSRFSPERMLNNPTLTTATTFAPESLFLPKTPTGIVLSQGREPSPILSDDAYDHIPKPKGEFSRPSDGYTIESICTKQFRWDINLFKEVKVGSGNIIYSSVDARLIFRLRMLSLRWLMINWTIRYHGPARTLRRGALYMRKYVEPNISNSL
jgi:hypothetical protein